MKAKEICDMFGRGIPYVMIISYILDKGCDIINGIKDEDISAVDGNAFMTSEFCRAIIRTAREVVKECSQDEIIQLIKAEWCCAGEKYDPDKGQFVKADWYEEEDEDGE